MRALALTLLATAAACGRDPSAPGPAGDGPALEARVAAAAQVAATDPACTPLGAFYWELGDVHGPLASGTAGAGVGAATPLALASASKLVFAAYVLERRAGALTAADLEALRMLSGHVGFANLSCAGAATVQACADIGTNTALTPAEVGRFHYDGGHFQAWAVAEGLGGLGDATLAAEYERLLGSDLDLTFTSPQPAGGMRGTAALYGRFLRKLLAGALRMGAALGQSPLCTLPASCATATYSPVPEAWHYSLGHWVEDAPGGDGAFSSPGAFGFYPWIDASRTFYGVLARQDTSDGAYWASVQCGRRVRRAFLTGAPSSG